MTENLQDSEDEFTSEANMKSFIVRVWREESANKKRRAVWRGFVSSVPSGERHYFSDINKIPELIVAQLQE